jgi:predicted HTH domain antitoxin
MKSLVLHLPDDLDFDDQMMTRFIAAKLYGYRKLSLADAAKMAGVSKWDFPHILAQFGVDYFDFSPEELARDVINARPRHS